MGPGVVDGQIRPRSLGVGDLKGLALLLALLLVTLTALSWAAAPGGPEDVLIEAAVYGAGDGTMVTMDFDLPNSGAASVAGILPVSAVVGPELYVLQDDGWDNGSLDISVLRLYDHLRAELPLYIKDVQVNLISADGLDAVFSSGNSTLVMASWSDDSVQYAAAAREWVKDGGVIIGIGGYSVPFIIDPREANIWGMSYLMKIEMDELDFDGGRDSQATTPSMALDLGYIAPQTVMNVDDITRYGGYPIGFIYQRENVTTTHALLPLGLGSVVLLGGDLALPYLTTAEDIAAQDIERILATSLPFLEGDMAYTNVTSDGTFDHVFTEDGPFVVYVMSVDHHVQWFAREELD
jgi:hypothetical protein